MVGYYKPIPSTIVTIFLSGIGFLIIGEGLQLENSLNAQNWSIIIIGIMFVVFSLLFAKSALKLASSQSRLDASEQSGSIPLKILLKTCMRKNADISNYDYQPSR